jgi:hypothetical protein
LRYPAEVDQLLLLSGSAKPGLVLGDLGPKNIFVEPGAVRFLDMERAFVGDQSFDLGFLLAHYLVEVPPEIRADSVTAVSSFMTGYKERISNAGQNLDSYFETLALRWLGVMIEYRISGSYMGRPIRNDTTFWHDCSYRLITSDSPDVANTVSSLIGLEPTEARNVSSSKLIKQIFPVECSGNDRY